MNSLLEKLLYQLARFVLWQQQPTIIGITGSVGKTSTKEAIYAVLATKFHVRKTIGNYNNEIGVPLTIIGNSSGGRNPIKWAWIISKALVYGFVPLPYPKILVLEMGVDHPGDIKYLTRLAPVHIGVVTAIGDQPVHLEFFKDVDHLAKEKMTMYTHQHKDDMAILNLDEPYTRSIQEKVKSDITSIAIHREADLQAEDITYSTDPRELEDNPHVSGLRFKVRYQGSVVPYFMPGVIGLPPVYSALFATAVGKLFDMNLVEVSKALTSYQPPKGRMNLLAGRKYSMLIDDTYNSSPAAVREALAVVKDITTSGRKIVCLGNMEELGKQSKRAHTLLGKTIALQEIDNCITVGEKAAYIAEAALANGMPKEAVLQFETVDDALEMVYELIDNEDVVLVKGSQSARMEKIVKSIMADPDQAKDLLVRQYGSWLRS